MSKINIAIVGAGFMGEVHANAYKNIPEVNIVGVVDKSDERANAFAAKFGCKAFSDVFQVYEFSDALDICLPTKFHKDVTIAAFEKGLDVICEKPVSLDLQEAKDMQAAAQKHNRIYMIAHVVRFWAEYFKLAQMIKSGEVKNIKQMTLSRYGSQPAWSEGNWMLSDKKSGGIIYDLAIHDIDYALSLFGMPKWVYATRSMLGDDYTAYVNAQLGYDHVNVLLEIGFIMPPSYPFTMGFRLSTGDEALEYVHKSQEGLQKYSATGKEKVSYEDYDPYQRELEHFIHCVQTRTQPTIGTGDEAINSLKIAQIIEKSAQTNTKIEV